MNYKQEIIENEGGYHFAPYTEQRDTLRKAWRNVHIDWYEFLFKAEECNDRCRENCPDNSNASLFNIIQNIR